MYYISFTGTAEQFISLLLITNSLFMHKNLQSTNETQKNMVLNMAGLQIFYLLKKILNGNTHTLLLVVFPFNKQYK